MLRHTNSFLLSIILHVALLIGAFFTYTYVERTKGKDTQIIKINLATVCIPQEIQEVQPKIKPTIKKENFQPKKIIQKKKELIPVEKIIPKQINKKPIKEEPQRKQKLEPTPNPILKKTTEQKPITEKTTSTKVSKKISKKPLLEEKSKSQLANEYINKNLQIITKLLRENLYYPRSARKRGITGQILIKFTLSPNADVHSIQIISSKSDILSRAAITTIENLSNKFPKPNQELTLNVPINYTLSR